MLGRSPGCSTSPGVARVAHQVGEPDANTYRAIVLIKGKTQLKAPTAMTRRVTSGPQAPAMATSWGCCMQGLRREEVAPLALEGLVDCDAGEVLRDVTSGVRAALSARLARQPGQGVVGSPTRGDVVELPPAACTFGPSTRLTAQLRVKRARCGCRPRDGPAEGRTRVARDDVAVRPTPSARSPS